MNPDTTPGFTERFFTAQDGLKLHARDYGEARDGRLPLVCLPGLSRNARDFHQLALLLSRHPTEPRRVICLDYRGRGRSDRDPDPANYALAVECRDVLTVCAALGLKRSLFAGTSRGGLILHLIAALQPKLIAAAVLNDIGPEIEPAGLAEIRNYLTRSAKPDSFDEAADMLRGIHGHAFPALTPQDWNDMAQAIYRESEDGIVADFDPALTLPLQAMDFEKPLPTIWPQFAALATRPLLVVRAEHSRILSARTFERMAKENAAIRTLTAHGQGHAPLLHHPEIYPVIFDFLKMF